MAAGKVKTAQFVEQTTTSLTRCPNEHRFKCIGSICSISTLIACLLLLETPLTKVKTDTYQFLSSNGYLSSNLSTNTTIQHPYLLYISERDYMVPLPSPIPDPPYNSNVTTIYSRVRNLTFNATVLSNGWAHYRLGDMFWSHQKRTQRLGYQVHFKTWPQSIAVEYMKRIEGPPFNGTVNGEQHDWDIMVQVLNERVERNETLQKMVPDNRTLVIHLRTGDVIDVRNNCSIREYLTFDDTFEWYTRGLPFFGAVWDKIQNDHIQIERIMVITGFHFDIPHFRSIAYINEVIKYLEQMVDRVDIRLNENPDEDVIIMSHSKYFVESGGGFSRLMAGLVRENGGIVYGSYKHHKLRMFYSSPLQWDENY